MKIITAGKLGIDAGHLSSKQLGETNQLDVHAQDGLGVSPTARQRSPQVPPDVWIQDWGCPDTTGRKLENEKTEAKGHGFESQSRQGFVLMKYS